MSTASMAEPSAIFLGKAVAVGLHCERVASTADRGNSSRKIFAERFPNLTVAYGRQTNRHAEALKRIGYSLGGEAGFQLALNSASIPVLIRFCES